jgi:hypothetical protein
VTESGCADVVVRLSAWLDGELDASAAAEVREHVAVCTSCQRRHALLRAAGRAVRSLPEEEVSTGFEDAFRRRLAAARTGAGRPRGRSLVLLSAAGLAAVLVLAVLGALAWRRASAPAAAPATSAKEVPRWLATCGAPTAAGCRQETPCASALACGVFPLDGLSARAARAAVPAGAPCASGSTCGAVFLVSTASAGRFSETSPPAFGKPR